jgi:hypothetical protein
MRNHKKLVCAWLYADGHAILNYEKHDPDAGMISFVEIHERFCNAEMEFKGRIVFHRYHCEGYLKLAKMAKRIAVRHMSLEAGSDKTRELGIAVGHTSFQFPDGADVCFLELDCISTGFKYQPEISEEFNPSANIWGTSKVGKIHRVTPKQ